MDFQREKNLLRRFYDAADEADETTIDSVLGDFTSPCYNWRGFHPFGEITTAESLAEQFWRPFKQSLRHQQRRVDIFFAGRNQIDDFSSTWVVSMGHIMGLFDRAWLGIPPTGKMALLRYGEFNRIADDHIVETAFYFDLPHLMQQAGCAPFPPQTGAELIQPGPRTHDGLLFTDAPKAEGDTTLALINAMIADIGQWRSDLPLDEELRRTWDEKMIWWGPTGIGASYTIARYIKQHAEPFRQSFADRSSTHHIARLAEGHYGGFFGWPNFSARPTGGFMGMPATQTAGDFRVIDIYRRAGNKLAENWVFIDLLHFWAQQGVDILARMTEVPHR